MKEGATAVGTTRDDGLDGTNKRRGIIRVHATRGPLILIVRLSSVTEAAHNSTYTGSICQEEPLRSTEPPTGFEDMTNSSKDGQPHETTAHIAPVNRKQIMKVPLDTLVIIPPLAPPPASSFCGIHPL